MTSTKLVSQWSDIMMLITLECGLTADEVSEHLNLPMSSVSARMSELKRDGFIDWYGTRRRTRNGCWAKVMVKVVLSK